MKSEVETNRDEGDKRDYHNFWASEPDFVRKCKVIVWKAMPL